MIIDVHMHITYSGEHDNIILEDLRRAVYELFEKYGYESLDMIQRLHIEDIAIDDIKTQIISEFGPLMFLNLTTSLMYSRHLKLHGVIASFILKNKPS